MRQPSTHIGTQNPLLDAGVSPVDRRRMMYMTGLRWRRVAAGAAALMLQANPTLTPNLIKALLMYTAQPLAGFNMLEQGAGEINIEGAIRLARLVRTDLSPLTPFGASLLTTPVPPVQQSTIAGQTFTWSGGLLFKYKFATGSELITNTSRLSIGVLFGEAVLINNGVFLADRTILTGACW